jgi:hypothetical protein
LSRRAGDYVRIMDSAAKAISQTGSRQQSRRVSQVRGELATKIRLNVLEEGGDKTASLLEALLPKEFFLRVDSGDFDDDSVPGSVMEETQDRIVSFRAWRGTLCGRHWFRW